MQTELMRSMELVGEEIQILSLLGVSLLRKKNSTQILEQSKHSSGTGKFTAEDLPSHSIYMLSKGKREVHVITNMGDE